MSRLPISLLILARNEEKAIVHAICPLRNVVSEVLVMDTGSTDRTISVARRLGAKVYQTTWKNNYSSPRNALIAKASQPWILFLDADQRIARCDVEKLRRLVFDSRFDVYFLPHRNYTSDFNLLSGWHRTSGEYFYEERLAGAGGYYSDFRPCLFRSMPKVRYSFAIHETIQPAIDKLGLRSAKPNLVIHHFEFNKGLKHHHKKHLRYLRAEAKLLRDIPRRSGNYFRLLENAVVDSISCGKELERAKKWCELLLAHNPKKASYWMHAARIAVLQRDSSRAEKLLRRGIQNCETPDLCCLFAWVLYQKGDESQCRSYVKRALWLDKNHLVSLNLKAMILANEMHLEQSLQVLNHALRLHPQYLDARFNRAVVQLSMGRPKRATSELRKLISIPLEHGLKRDVASVLKKISGGKS